MSSFEIFTIVLDWMNWWSQIQSYWSDHLCFSCLDWSSTARSILGRSCHRSTCQIFFFSQVNWITVQYGTVQYSTILYISVQYGAVICSAKIIYRLCMNSFKLINYEEKQYLRDLWITLLYIYFFLMCKKCFGL